MNQEISVKRFLSEDKFQWGIVICCQLIFIGFVCSRALVSIGMVTLLVISLLQNGVLESITRYFHRKELWILSIFFLIVFVSGIYSEDKAGWLNWVRIKLPYLALPIAFVSLKKIEGRKFIVLLYGFVFTFFASASVILANYFLNYEFINESFLRGNGIPMPYSHIRYTLMLTFALFVAGYLWSNKMYLFNTAEKWVQLFFVVFSFLSLHVLAVRSALLALYISLLLVLIQYTVVRKKFLQSAGILLGLFIVLFIAIEYVPSLHNKLGFMNYDRIMYEQGQVKNLTDGIRIASIKGALLIAKENFWLGIGAGDLRNEMNNFYNQRYPEIPVTDHKLPHNQFVWVLATTGIFGLVFFLFAFFFPFFYRGNSKHWLFAVFHLILFSSFFTEATLEEQMGTGFYLIFLLLLMNHFKKE